MTLFDANELKGFLDLLKKEKESDSSESYSNIKRIFSSIVFPIPCFKIPKGTKFVRTRIHKDDEAFFTSIDEISYRKDLFNIKSFGRCNEPGQSFFYCANDDSISLMEATEIIRNSDDKATEMLTTGLWISTEDIFAASLLSNSSIRGQHTEIDALSTTYEKAFDNQNDDNAKILQDLIHFLSIEFSTKALGDSKQYKITAGFSNYVFETIELADAILYPSTIFNEKGFNFAIPPEVVDNKFKFICANRRTFKRVSPKNYFEVEFIESQMAVEGSKTIQWPKL